MSCYPCANDGDDAPIRERAYRGEFWRVAHATCSLPGWTVVVPRRHVTRIEDLTAAEAAELGPLLRAVSAGLRRVVGCEKTYVMMFAEKVEHVHFHVVPRAADIDPEHVGPRIVRFLAEPPERWVPEAERDRIARGLAAFL